MYRTLILFLLGLNTIAYGQNLISNPSFEKATKISPYWMTSNIRFDAAMRGWKSPTLGSPDILFNRIIHKMQPIRKGVNLSEHRARTGKMMVGIKTYGCESMTQHCKEYIQI